MDPAVKHYCGLFGIANHPSAPLLTYYGLYAQQHRGQESAGITVAQGGQLERVAGLGVVTDALNPEVLQQLRGTLASGHVRYSTTGSCTAVNTQPLMVNCSLGQVAIAHNGNLVNAAAIRHDYEHDGHIFTTTSDTEVVLHMLADRRFADQPDPLAAALRHLSGSYCFLLTYPDRIEAVRDPSGNRPLCLGQLDDAWVVASETCALDIVDAVYVRDVEPGEIVTLTENGMSSRRFVERGAARPAYCVFEHVYFADPASLIFGENVHEARKRTGRQLAREAPCDADVVIAVPNCARCAALGYHEASEIPFGRGFTTNHYVGRSFIQPTQAIRDLTVKMKLNPIKSTVNGQRVVVVEDSVVRGTTTRGKMQALREAGAKEIHLRVASPPIRHPCFYGIDFPSRGELVANQRQIDEITRYLGVDSLAYLSLEGMLGCFDLPAEHFCSACFSGKYPIPIDETFEKDVFEKRQLKFFEPRAEEVR